MVQCCFFYDNSVSVSVLVPFSFKLRPFLLPKLVFIEIELTDLRFVLIIPASWPHVPLALGIFRLPSLSAPFFPLH